MVPMIKEAIYLFLVMFSFSFGAMGQLDTIPEKRTDSMIFVCRIGTHNLEGDSTQAIHSRHHDYTGSELKAFLGYIDTTVATAKEFRDNLAMGLVARPGNLYQIESFSFSIYSKWRDIRGPFFEQGNRIPYSSRYYDIWSLNLGDRIFFDNIRARRKGADHTVPLKDGIVIKIVK